MAMRAHADALGFLHGYERRLVDSWADGLDAIAEGLTEAIHEKSTSRLGWFIRAAGRASAAVGVSVVAGASGGGAQSLADDWLGAEEVHACAQAVLSGLDDLETMSRQLEVGAIDSDMIDAAISPETVTAKIQVPTPTMGGDTITAGSTVSGVGSTRAEPMTATGTGRVTSGEESGEHDELLDPTLPGRSKYPVDTHDGPTTELDAKPIDHVLEVADVHVGARISPVTLEVHADETTDDPT